MSWVAVGVAVVGAASSAKGSRDQAKAAKKANRAGSTARQRELRDSAADQLDALATKMLNGEPISQAERNTIDRATSVADQQIQRASIQGMQQALQFQAGTGFLKGGRTADQIRKLSLEGSLDRQQVQVAREQQLQNLIENRRNQAISILKGQAGIQPDAQQATGLPTASLVGSGLTGLSGSLFQMNAANNQASQNAALLKAQQDPNATNIAMVDASQGFIAGQQNQTAFQQPQGGNQLAASDNFGIA